MLSYEIPAGFFNSGILAIDTETTCRDISKHADPWSDRTLLVSLCNGTQSIVLKPHDSWLPELWAAMKDPNNVTIAQNVSFDLQMLWALGFEGAPARIWDTMLAEQVILGGLNDGFNLAAIAFRRCDIQMEKSTRATFLNHTGEFTDEQLRYSRKDAEVLPVIMHRQYAELEARGLLATAELENSTVPAVARMEYEGMGFDTEVWADTVAQETAKARVLEQSLQLELALADYSFDLLTGDVHGINLDSHAQVLAALTRSGISVDNTRAETLKLYLAKYPDTELLRRLMDHRHVVKCLGYNYPRYINPYTGRIHTSFMQIRAQTGRFSSSKPNLQNVPKAPLYRRCFIARPGWLLVRSDAGQQEMRILAELSGDEALLEVCRKADVHLEIGRQMYHEPGMVKSDPRRNTAKNCAFAMSYGAKPKRVALMANISLADATLIVEFVTNAFPVAMRWADRQVQYAKDIGYVRTIGGRRRNFKRTSEDEYIDNQARNAPVQGTAADIMKRALWQINARLLEEGKSARPVMTVHDEVIVEAPESEAEYVASLVVAEMQAAGGFYVHKVPMPADVTIAPCWQK